MTGSTPVPWIVTLVRTFRIARGGYVPAPAACEELLIIAKYQVEVIPGVITVYQDSIPFQKVKEFTSPPALKMAHQKGHRLTREEFAEILLQLSTGDRRRVHIRDLQPPTRPNGALPLSSSSVSPINTPLDSPATPESATQRTIEVLTIRPRAIHTVDQMIAAEELQTKRNKRLPPRQRRSPDVWGAHRRTMERQREVAEKRQEAEEARRTKRANAVKPPKATVQRSPATKVAVTTAVLPVRQSGRERRMKKFFDEG